jgi:hypothetical protein
VPAFTRYRVIETQTVTDAILEQIINEWVIQGWSFDGIQFAMRESSKRPAMAFVIFTRAEADTSGETTPSTAS